MQQLAEPEADLRRYIRPKGITRMYGISASVVYAAIYSGELPAIKFRGSVWLIKPEDADAWIERNSESNVPRAAA